MSTSDGSALTEEPSDSSLVRSNPRNKPSQIQTLPECEYPGCGRAATLVSRYCRIHQPGSVPQTRVGVVDFDDEIGGNQLDQNLSNEFFAERLDRIEAKLDTILELLEAEE